MFPRKANDSHNEHSVMIKCQICNCQIKNCTCPGTAHLCKTCRERNTLDEQGNCTCCPNCRGSKINDSCSCCSICSGSQETCNCCKVCGKPRDSCQGCCNTCKQVQCECVCHQCQQTQCSCCKTCQLPATSCICCLECHQSPCVCCKNCKKPDCGDCCTRCLQRIASCNCCPRCQATKDNCNCPPKAQVLTKIPKSSTMSSIEPPDISILKDRSQLEFYISALERWANIAKASGIADTLLADFVRLFGPRI